MRLVWTRRTETASEWTRLSGARLTESRLVGMTPAIVYVFRVNFVQLLSQRFFLIHLYLQCHHRNQNQKFMFIRATGAILMVSRRWKRVGQPPIGQPVTRPQVTY